MLVKDFPNAQCQGPYEAARVGFEPATLLPQDSKLTSDPPRLIIPVLCVVLPVTRMPVVSSPIGLHTTAIVLVDR